MHYISNTYNFIRGLFLDNRLRYSVLVFIFLMIGFGSFAQTTVEISDKITSQHIFENSEICYFKENHPLDIATVSNPIFQKNFKPYEGKTPKIEQANSVFWFKIKIKNHPQSINQWIIEFFDQTINEVHFYTPNGKGGFIETEFGDAHPFKARTFRHKNFVLMLKNQQEGTFTYFFKVRSNQSADVIVVLRSLNWFVYWALNEYLFFGFFYGMILVFVLYNVLIYVAIKRIRYIYYVIYMLGIGLYEMCSSGLAFQYLWPDHPSWNTYVPGFVVTMTTISGLLFGIDLLHLKQKAPILYKIIIWQIVLRSLLFIYSCFYTHLFHLKFVEFISVATLFYAGGYQWYVNKHRSAKLYTIGYSFVMLGFIIKFFIMLQVSWVPFGPITHYSLSVFFIIEMICLSFAIGDRVRHLREKQEQAQMNALEQLRKNHELQKQVNEGLEMMVNEKAKEIIEQSKIIATQNENLTLVNQQLTIQAEAIKEMNELLSKDNLELRENISQVTQARVLSQNLSFEEFCKTFPNKEVCLQLLAELKWSHKEYACKKCKNTLYCAGQVVFSRRCTKCSYDESPLTHTLMQGSHIPLNKAFYMIYLIYRSKASISSHQLAEKVGIRQSTCWTFLRKTKRAMREIKKNNIALYETGWQSVLMYDENPKKE